NYTQPLFKNILNQYVKDIPKTPSSSNYQSAHKLCAEECLADCKENECAFHLSESVDAGVRILAVYREEQCKIEADKLQKIKCYIQPVKDIVENTRVSQEDEEILDLLCDDDEITKILDDIDLNDDQPYHMKYMRFGPHNNVDNFLKIIEEMPKEWTIVQLTAPYNPNENFKSMNDYRNEVNSIFLSVFTNDYLGSEGPITVTMPANIVKEGEKPLFTELFSLLDDNYKTIDNAQYLNNKRLIKNYWSRREEIDLRIKSVINVMDKEWLGGWSSLLTGKLMDSSVRDNLKAYIDSAFIDWGFLKLNKKQKILIYNLMESAAVLPMQQVKSCVRKILTEYGNIEEIRTIRSTIKCDKCSADFRFTQNLCLKCLSKCFEEIHKFTLADGIRAFSQVATHIKDGEKWSALKRTKRQPIKKLPGFCLKMFKRLDTFPWESLPILTQQPVSRIENIHFLYALFKTYQPNIREGYYSASADVGRYVINPERDLDRMQHRMESFIKYWCSQWSGHCGEPPGPQTLAEYLAQADIFLYCGHGDGCQSSSANTSGHAVCLLSGCGSARLVQRHPRAPPAAAHQYLHVAAHPIVVGMLWEVTDLEVDKLVSTLLSLYVPSTAQVDWKNVDVEQKGQRSQEPDLLRAICKSRTATNFLMIATSIVARGIPVRITSDS
ncbi:unnamed protein product, partial [Leptidea sinapis]